MKMLLVPLVACLPLQAEVEWLGEPIPPDKTVLDAYVEGEVSDLQLVVAEAWVGLAREWSKPGNEREVGDACRQAMLGFLGYVEAQAIYDRLKPLPKKRQ